MTAKPNHLSIWRVNIDRGRGQHDLAEATEEAPKPGIA